MNEKQKQQAAEDAAKIDEMLAELKEALTPLGAIPEDAEKLCWALQALSYRVYGGRKMLRIVEGLQRLGWHFLPAGSVVESRLPSTHEAWMSFIEERDIDEMSDQEHQTFLLHTESCPKCHRLTMWVNNRYNNP
jgi:hypothetical protein